MLQQLAGRVSVSPVAAAACAAAATPSPCEAAANERPLGECAAKRDFCSAVCTAGSWLSEGAVTEARLFRESGSNAAGPLVSGSKGMSEGEGPTNSCGFPGSEGPAGESFQALPPWLVKVESAAVSSKGSSESEESRSSSGIGKRVSSSAHCVSSSKAFLRGGGHVPSQEDLHAELATFELLTQLRVVARRWALHQDNFFFHWNRLRFEWRARSGLSAGSGSCTKPEEEDFKTSFAYGDRRSPNKAPLQYSGRGEDPHLRAAEPASDSVDTLCSFLPKFWSQKRSSQAGTLLPGVAAVLQQLDARRRALDDSYIPLSRFLGVPPPSPEASSPAVSRLESGVSRQESPRTLSSEPLPSEEPPCEAQRIVVSTEPADCSIPIPPTRCTDHASSNSGSSSSSSNSSSSTLTANVPRPSSVTALMAPYLSASSSGSAAAAATTRALHAAAGLAASPSWSGSCGPWDLCGGARIDDPASEEACCGSSFPGPCLFPESSAVEKGNVASTPPPAPEASSYQCLVQHHSSHVRLRPSADKPCCTAYNNSSSNSSSSGSSNSSRTEGPNLAPFARRVPRVCIRKAGGIWASGPHHQAQQHAFFRSPQAIRDAGGHVPTVLPPAPPAAPALPLHATAAAAASDRSGAAPCCLGGAGGVLPGSTLSQSDPTYFGRQSEEGASPPAQQPFPAAAAAAAAGGKRQHEAMWEDGPLKPRQQPLQQHCGFSAAPPPAAKAAAVCNDLQQRHEQLRGGAGAQQQQKRDEQQHQQQHLGPQGLHACMQPQTTGALLKGGVDDPHKAKPQQQEQSGLQQQVQQQQQQQQQRVLLAAGSGGETSFTKLKEGPQGPPKASWAWRSAKEKGFAAAAAAAADDSRCMLEDKHGSPREKRPFQQHSLPSQPPPRAAQIVKETEATREGERDDVGGPLVESDAPQSTPAAVSSSSSSFDGASSAKATRKTSHIVVEDGGLRLSFVARKGVYYDKRRRLWRANWKENGRIHTKGFSVHDYSSHQMARQKAIEFRESKEQEIDLYLQPVIPSPKAAGNPLASPAKETSPSLLQPPMRM